MTWLLVAACAQALSVTQAGAASSAPFGEDQPAAVPSFPPHLVGTADAVAALVDRVLQAPGTAAERFSLTVDPTVVCPGVRPGVNCFHLSDDAHTGRVAVTGTTASEVVAGVGVYLREWCGVTVGWSRGGGSHVFVPDPWPSVGAAVSRARSVPYSHVSQVCTHSYTLVWHGWDEWERFIDWMALAGHNSILAPTGQEEVQYKVLTTQFGLSDMEVRNWTNGPAWLTWSRGQNSHGNGIGGPLPRSFMKGQWDLQRQILARYRELGIAGHLPSFGGYAPWALAVAQNATDRIARGKGAANDTAWVDGRDPLYTEVADAWMKQLLADFGSDHVWQMDGFFANGSSWGAPVTTPCEWSDAVNSTYLAGYVHGAPLSYPTLDEAKAQCLDAANIANCGGVVSRDFGKGPFELRAGLKPILVPAADGEASYVVTNRADCYKPSTEIWRNRSAAAYGAVARADGPTARWIYQGYALGIRDGGLGPASDPNAIARVHSFASPVPKGQFILLDMSAHGTGEFREWKGKWGLPFIWTALHTYGGNLGIKGNLSEVNAIPFDAPPLAPVPDGYDPATQAVGVGYTPEGLDQNPAYYELLQEAAFASGPKPNITDWLVRRAHRRYGLARDGRAGAEQGSTARSWNLDVAAAWAALASSGYAVDKGVSDGSGVGFMGILSELQGLELTGGFNKDRRTPSQVLCLEWSSWGSLNKAAAAVAAAAGGRALPEPFLYDLVNTGREVLAQLSTPLLLNFSSSFSGDTLSPEHIKTTSGLFVELLGDLDSLLSTNTAFMLGPWLARARRLGGNATDCVGTRIAGDIGRCDDFMEWNARAQLTTWYPVLGSPSAPHVQQGGRDHDYARKQWSGLVRDVYARRALLYRDQALRDAAAGRRFNDTAAAEGYARQAFLWQTGYPSGYSVSPSGDAVAVSTALRAKWAPYFSSCVAL